MESGHESLLLKVADNFDRLRQYTHAKGEEHGIGAIVFFDESAEITEDRIECEFWPMGKLRDCLRQLDEYDERVYRWLREAGESEALPVVVFLPGKRPGTLDLSFHQMTQHHRN